MLVMRKFLKNFPLLIIALLVHARCYACDLCAVYRSVEAKSATPGLNLGVFEQYTHFGTMQLDGRQVPNPAGQRLDSSITQFLVGYQFTDSLGLQLNVPYIYRSFRRPTPDGAIENGTESGVGDLSLIGLYRPVTHLTEQTLFVWELVAGVKFPTGSSSRIREELAETEPAPGVPESGIHGHDLALGSGSYDGIVGSAIFASWQRLFVTAALQYDIRSRGAYQYRYADDLSWHFKPGGYLWLTHENSLGLQLALSGEHKGKDDLAGVSAEDTGMTAVFLGPELSYTWQEHLSAELGAEFPLIQDNTALQLVPDYRVKAAVTWHF
jgi:hypothetical protein